MLRRNFRIGLLVGLLGGALAAVAKAVQGRAGSRPAPAAPAPWTPLPDAQPVVVPPRSTPAPPPPPPPPPAPAPTPPVERPAVRIADLQEAPVAVPAAPAAKKKAPAAAKVAPWVEPVDGDCPASHPIKAKMASGIFHVPGGLSYARTRPDRCYRDAAAAEADGLRPSKR